MKRGLGKGLDALFEDNAIESTQGSVVTLPLTEIEPNRGQPRHTFDTDALQQLADSIREHGILQPLVVRPMKGTGAYQLVAGERRWRAARMAGLSEAPVVIRDLDDREAMEIALIENLQREDLNPIEEAEGYRTLMETFSLTQEEVAQRVGKSRPAVANAMRLLGLPDILTKMVRDGALSAGHARALLGAGDEAAMKRIADLIVSKGLSVREAEKLSKKRESEPKPETKQLPGVLAFELEHSLTESLGRKVKVTQGGSKGSIQIEFYGEEDLRQLAALLAALQTNH